MPIPADSAMSIGTPKGAVQKNPAGPIAPALQSLAVLPPQRVAITADRADDVQAFPLSLGYGWGNEVWELMIERGLDFDTAFANVMARYLDEGDVRPLLELLGTGNEPGPATLTYLAGM